VKLWVPFGIFKDFLGSRVCGSRGFVRHRKRASYNKYMVIPLNQFYDILSTNIEEI